MKFIYLFTLFYSFIDAGNYKIEKSLVTYFGNHVLHKWEGSTNDVQGLVRFDEQKNH